MVYDVFVVGYRVGIYEVSDGVFVYTFVSKCLFTDIIVYL